MKIAILSFYSGLVDRGVETWAYNLQKRIDGIEVISGTKNESITYNSIRNIGKIYKADIVIPTNGRFQVFLSKVVTLFSGKRLIVFGHSGPGADDKWNLLCAPNVFVAFSETQKKWAEKYKLPFTKVIKISHAVDTDKFTPRKYKPKKKIVLCVSANTPAKRVNLVREAVSKLHGYKFIAVGKGNDTEVKFSEMPDVYKKADVFCFVPKAHEAFGLVFLEALATNLPVVTIDDAVRHEIVGSAGLYVKNPKDIGSLAKAIDTAYNRNWGDKPRDQAMEFSWNKIIKNYESLFFK